MARGSAADMSYDMMAGIRHLAWHGTKGMSRLSHRVEQNQGSDTFLSNDMMAVTGQRLSRLSHHVEQNQGSDTFLRRRSS